MLKSYEELRKVDISQFVKKRDGKDYLNWAKCIDLLHEHGAEKVYFEPITNENGSSVFMSEQVFEDKNGVKNRCYEVKVKITIDENTYYMQSPIMNGSNPVKDNSMSQQRVWNAQTRAFVKGVAIYTGLGFSLWMDDDDLQPEDLSKHDINKIRQRVLEKVTLLMKRNLSKDDINQLLTDNGVTEEAIYSFLGKKPSVFDKYNGLFLLLDRFEKALNKL